MYNRISIIGGCGSGKSTLANLLSKELNIPVIHLDSINFNENWVEIDKTKRDEIIFKMSKGDKWIIDGNYYSTLKDRLDKSNLIIWLDYSTFQQIKGIIKRFISFHDKERPEIPGCKERFSLKFFNYVLKYNKNKRPKLLKILEDIPKEKLLIFKKQKDLNNWLVEFTNNKKILKDIY